MALIGPVLDDRTYEQLKDELVKRIPVYAPEWTDHNESDPGIALLELFAYLGESLLFRFNQIPDATKIAYLRLLGLAPRSAQSARSLLALQTERPTGAQVLAGTEARAGAVSFETSDEVVAWPLEVVAVGKRPVTRATGDATEKHRRQHALQEAGVDPTKPHRFYEVVALPPDPADPAAVPLDVRTTADDAIWIALLATATTDVSQLPGRTLFVGVAFDEDLERPFDLTAVRPRPSRLLESTRLTSAPPAVEWQLWKPADADRPLQPLVVLGDTTRGMTTTGVVKLEVPDPFPTQDRGAVGDGGRDAPPPLDDAATAGRVVAWLRVGRPADENDTIHSVRWVGVNAVAVEQVRTAQPELLGTGTAEPGQVYRLTQHPVVPGTVELDVEEATGWTRWTEVESFAASGSLDRHYTVDLPQGLVQFGPRSRAPQLGERIRVTRYRYGGGTQGNVPAKAISQLTGVASVKAANVLPAVGGADPASLPEALDSIPGQVHRRDRAVVAEDFQTLALEVSGVARADTLPLFHPDTPNTPAAGVVSVVVFPDEDPRNPGAPLPDIGLLRRVAEYLQPRRLVTTELYVIPPTYREIAASVGIRVKEGYQIDAVRRWVALILRQYLSPLPPYGPDGHGWPLGRTVRRAELAAVCTQVDGVESLVGPLRLAVIDRPAPASPGGPGPAPVVTKARTVRLQPWEVPQLSTVSVVGGKPVPVIADPGGTGGPGPALVPLPPDVC
jgi:predicted phage baseplate assembly protein